MAWLTALKFKLRKISPFLWISSLLLVSNLVIYLFPGIAVSVPETEPLEKYAEIVTIEPSLKAVAEIVTEETVEKAEVVGEHATKAEIPVHEQSKHSEITEHVVDAVSRQDVFVCYELGPAENKSEQAYLEETLAGYGISTQVETRQLQKELGHWVFLPPLRSKALGRLKLEEIKLKGIKDVVLLTKNEPKFAISLGVFNDKKYAHRRLLKIQSLGFQAQMDIRHKTINQNWLKIKTTVENDLDEMSWSTLIQDYPHIVLKSVDCK